MWELHQTCSLHTRNLHWKWKGEKPSWIPGVNPYNLGFVSATVREELGSSPVKQALWSWCKLSLLPDLTQLLAPIDIIAHTSSPKSLPQSHGWTGWSQGVAGESLVTLSPQIHCPQSSGQFRLYFPRPCHSPIDSVPNVASVAQRQRWYAATLHRHLPQPFHCLSEDNLFVWDPVEGE